MSRSNQAHSLSHQVLPVPTTATSEWHRWLSVPSERDRRYYIGSSTSPTRPLRTRRLCSRMGTPQPMWHRGHATRIIGSTSSGLTLPLPLTRLPIHLHSLTHALAHL